MSLAEPPHPVPMRQRLLGIAALAVPVVAGLGYLVTMGAPRSFIVINTSALGLAILFALFGRAPRSARTRRLLIIGLLALLFLPLFTGPFIAGMYIEGIARWLPLGPITLHAGALLFPAIAVLAAQDEDFAPPMLLAALLAASFQPDAALGFAVVFAAIGLHDVTKDWRFGVTCIVGFFASLAMALRGELPAQPFVERVLINTAQTDPFIALALLVALVIGFFGLLFLAPMERRSRYALAGSLFGFSLMAIYSNYPSVLIGYGAAPILGYGLALGLSRRADT